MKKEHPSSTADLEQAKHHLRPAYSCPSSQLKTTDDLSYYANLLGLNLRRYNIKTKDGFIIALYRLSQNQPEAPANVARQDRKPVLLVHGLMQSSASFLTSGYKSLAYFLVSNNFDVWLGNNRCGFHPKHEKYSPNDHEMWDWDLTEMTNYDIPAMLDHIVEARSSSNSANKDMKISIVSHSQGTTQSVYLISKQFNNPYSQRIDKCVLLAPAVYGGPLLNSKLFIKFMRLLPDGLYDLFFGVNSFMPILMKLRKWTYKLPSFGLTSYMVFSYLFNWDDSLWDPSIRKFHFIFSPVYVSVKLMKWWLRSKDGTGFENGKPIIDDGNAWFTKQSPELFLVVGGKDDLVNGDLFIERLANIETEMEGRWSYMKIPEYSHLDVLWADDLLETIGGQVLSFLQK